MDSLRIKVILAIVLAVLLIGGGLIYGIFFTQKAYKGTLVIWGVYDQQSNYQSAIDAFRKLYPKVNISFIQKDPSTYQNDLKTALASGHGPDIFMIQNTWLPGYSSLLAPLSSTIGVKYGFGIAEYQNQFVDVASQDFVNNNNIYAVPLAMDDLQLYWNKDLFNNALIATPPRTWEEVLSEAPRLTIKDKQGNITQSAIALGTADNINRATDVLQTLMMQTGATMVNPTTMTAAFDQQQFRGNQTYNPGLSALNFYTSFSNPADPNYSWNNGMHYSIDSFTEGKLAMMVNYAYNISTIQKNNPRLNFGIAPLPQPASSSKVLTMANYWGYGVAATSPNQDEAWDFILFLAGVGKNGNSSYVNSYLKSTKQLPARRDLINQYDSDPLYGPFVDGALQATSWYQADPGQIETVFLQMIDAVVNGTTSAQNALSSAALQITNIIKKTQ